MIPLYDNIDDIAQGQYLCIVKLWKTKLPNVLKSQKSRNKIANKMNFLGNNQRRLKYLEISNLPSIFVGKGIRKN